MPLDMCRMLTSSVFALFFSERVSSQSQRRFLTEMGMPTTGKNDEKSIFGVAAFTE